MKVKNKLFTNDELYELAKELKNKMFEVSEKGPVEFQNLWALLFVHEILPYGNAILEQFDNGVYRHYDACGLRMIQDTEGCNFGMCYFDGKTCETDAFLYGYVQMPSTRNLIEELDRIFCSTPDEDVKRVVESGDMKSLILFNGEGLL